MSEVTMTNQQPAPRPAAPSRREATENELVRAARRRFALEGYEATRVRSIADDAGVNVALINRYFGSKEGLFEACLPRSVAVTDQPGRSGAPEIGDLIESLIAHVAESPTGDESYQLLLLLRSSGDARAERIRSDTMRAFAQKMAVIAGWQPHDPTTHHLLLHAQMALGVLFGIVSLRAIPDLQPIASAATADLSRPLGGILRCLLDRSTPPATGG